MESLSQEQLVRILRLAATASGPGHAVWLFLLDVAPRVCRRWRDAARDPRCWPKRDVVVKTPHCRGWRSDAAFKAACRLVARALGIRNLRITCEDHKMFEDEAVAKAVGRALQASQAVVEGVSMNAYVWEKMGEEDCAGFVRLLERSKMHIRWLHLCLDPRSTKKKAPKRRRGQPTVQEPRILNLIAQMPLLETLWLQLEGCDPELLSPLVGVHYSGELASMATPNLRALDIHKETIEPVGPAVVALVHDLLRCGAASLWIVKLPNDWPLSETTLQLLSACPRLAALSAHPSCLGAAAAVDRVRKLILDIKVGEKGKTAAVNAEAQQLVSEALTRCQGMATANLQALTLLVWGDIRKSKTVVTKCSKAIKGFAKFKPTVDVQLKIVPDDWSMAYWKKPVFSFSSFYDPDERHFSNDYDYNVTGRELYRALGIRGSRRSRNDDDCVIS